ncbi:restriction endonuclease subunit S, partial [Escherichia coli]|uniref:restriction endonuclease subunit S n=1 Tax=Escherichia coli TaxID=562 RepID=UPI00136F322D|nr:restriction endonuclease [Escherichia coli]
MSCRYLKIEDFCSTGSGGTPSRSKPEYYEGGDIPWIKSGDLKDSKIYEANEYITAAGLENSSAKIVEKDSILIAMYGATVGRLAILGINAATNQAICNIRPDTTIADMKYLYYFLKSKFSYFVENAVGGAQPNISQGLIKSLEVPLPSLDEQKRIADILDKAAGVCQKREQAIKLADDFLRAKFLEMFGTPANNIHRFPKGTIRDLVDSVNYGTSAKASIDSGEYPILRMGNITYQGRWDFTDLKYIDLSVKEKDKYLVKEGDLLFNRTNSKELVGKTAVYEEERPMAFAGYLIRVRPNSIGNNYYISGYLNSIHGKITLMNMCKSIVGMANINAQELQNIEILIPPKHLQDEYEII